MNKPCILVIDDEPDNFDVIETILYKQGYRLQYSSDGQQAIDSLDTFQPDLILLDVMMPGLDGIEVCKMIKALPQWRPVSIIMVTGLSTKEDLARCLKAGADDFITKPINSIELRARVDSMIRIKKQYDHLQLLLARQVVLEAEKLELLERRNIELEEQVAERTAEFKATAHRYAALASASPVGIFRTDAEGNCVYINDRWRAITGFTLETAIGMGWVFGLHPDDQHKIAVEWYRAFKENRPFQLEYRFQKTDGTVTWVFGQAVSERNADGEITGYVGTITDINDLKKAQELIAYNAVHDPLTDLPNRTLFLERLELAIKKAQELDNYHYAVLFLDLDRFKVINDSLGHSAGDQFLKSIAMKLKNNLQGNDLAARLGGDEFVILLEDITGIEEVIAITEAIMTDCEMPILVNEYYMSITASIGIVLGNEDYHQASNLLRDADIAMYKAKSQGRSCYKIFDAQMHTQAVKRLTLETDIRKAIKQKEFIVYYQPIMNILDNRLMGFEALIRWQHPTRGVVSPDEFIFVAEETGLIVQIDRWVFYTACQQLAS